MDLFESGPGSPQVHDLNGGILQSGLFWTVGLRPGSFNVSGNGRVARLHARGVPQVDTFVFAGSNHVSATVELEVRWEAIGPVADLGSGDSVPADDPAAFSGRFAPARATAEIEGLELGFAFEGEATSDLGYAQLGVERNGVFLD